MFLDFILAISLVWQIHLGYKYSSLVFYACNNIFIKYEPMVPSQCRDRLEESAEMMKNILRENNEI